MNKLFFFFALIGIPFSYIYAQETIPSVKIGDQEWTSENLSVETFQNGDKIPEAKTIEDWEKYDKARKPAWCYYDNSSDNGQKYGKLYNWFAVTDPRGLAPKGWHIPIDSEFVVLVTFLGGDDVAALKLKSKTDWNDKKGNNSSGFNAFPAGYRTSQTSFTGLQRYAYFWTATSNTQVLAKGRSLSYEMPKLMPFFKEKGNGYSIRCVKN